MSQCPNRHLEQEVYNVQRVCTTMLKDNKTFYLTILLHGLLSFAFTAFYNAALLYFLKIKFQILEVLLHVSTHLAIIKLKITIITKM